MTFALKRSIKMYLVTENSGKKVIYSKLTVIGVAYGISKHTLRASSRKMIDRLQWKFVSLGGIIIEEIENI